MKDWSFSVTPEYVDLDPDNFISKYGFTSGEDDEYFFWRIIINPNKKTLSNVTIEDTLGAGQKFKDNFVIIKNAELDIKGDFVEDSDEGEKCDINEFVSYMDDTKFTLNLGDISESYCITYEVELTYLLDIYYNTAILKSDNEIVEDYVIGEKIYKYSAVLNGLAKSSGTIQLTKVDADNKNLYLSGAVFELLEFDYDEELEYNPENIIGTYTTNDDGVIEITDLNLNKIYQLVEIVPPEGYQFNDTEIYCKFYNTTTEKLVVTNKKISEDDPDDSNDEPDS